MSYRHNFLVLYETFIIEVPSLLDVLVGWALNLHSLSHLHWNYRHIKFKVSYL